MSSQCTTSRTADESRPLRFLRMADVENKVGLHKRTIWRMINSESFPRPVRLGERAIGFVEGEIEDWMRQQLDNRSTRKGRGDE